jgi:hypothetical protein
MLPEPTGKGFGTAVSQQINWSMGSEIHQDGPICLTTPQRKVINTQDALCGERRGGGSLGSAQKRICTDGYAQLSGEAFTDLATEHRSKAIQDDQEARCSPPLNWDHFWYPLHKRLLHTLRIRTAKPAHAQDQPDTLTADRQIMRRTRVVAMDTTRHLLAAWTGGCWAESLSRNRKSGIPSGDLLHFETSQGKQKRMQEV